MKKFVLIFYCVFIALAGISQTFYDLNEQFMALYKKGEYKMALPIGIRAVQMAKTQFGERSENYAIATHNVASAYNELEQFSNAMPYYIRADKAYTAFFKSPENQSSAICNNSIGNIYLVQKKYDSAAPFYEKAFAFFIKYPKEEYENLIVLMNNFTDLYLSTGMYAKARIIYEKILPEIEKQEGRASANYTVTIANLISSLYNMQEYALAESQVKIGLPAIEKFLGTANTQYTEMLDMLGNCVRELGRLKEAEEINLRSLGIKQAFAVQDSAAIAFSYAGLANVYGDMSEFNRAFSYYEQALSLLDKLNMEESVDYVTIQKSFAYTCIIAGRLSEAKTLLFAVLKTQTKLYGSSYAGNGEVLISIGNAEIQLNELSAAEAHVVEGLAIIEKNYGKQNYAGAKAKEVLGLAYHKLGNSTKGITMFKDAVAINTKLFGEASKHTASVLSNLGLLYQELGNFAEAEIVLTRSLEIRKELLGIDHPDYALSLCNLAMIYVYQARYSQADKMLADALNIFLKKELGQSNNFISLLNNIAFMAEKQGDYREAKKLYLRLLEILEAKPEKHVGSLYLILNNLSIVCLTDENYTDALSYALKAMTYAKANQGIRSLEYIKSANNSVVAYRKLGNNAKAREQIKELIPLCKEVLGSDASLLGILSFNSAMLEMSEDNFEKAAGYLDDALKIYINGFRKNFYTLSEKEKLTWWQDQSLHFAMFPSLLKNYNQTSGPLVAAMVNHQLQLKGFVLNDASASLRKARTSGNAALKKLLDQWQLNRTLLAQQLALPVIQRLFSIDSLELIANNLEKNINQQAAGLINVQQQNSGNWQTILGSLKSGEAAVEFMRFPLYRNSDYTDTMQYAAIIIRKERPTPELVFLGNEKQIEWCLTGGKEDGKEIRINNLYRSSIGKKAITTFAGDSLYKLVWQPLMPYLENVQTIMYAPDGLLHKVAFQALPISNGKMLIDTFRLQQYASIRQLSAKLPGAEKYTSAYIMGNADFNNASSSSATSDGVKVSFSSNTSSTPSWSPLPGTEKEINILQPLFIAKGLKVSAETGSNATEEIFKGLNARSPSIIHLATHGFFLPDLQIKTSQEVNTSSNSYALSDEPLMRSGIIMAGANKAWKGEKTNAIEDGIVTAYEIAQLNLSNTKLVVLSACETALGDLKGSEGVFGLQRAFKIAGVKNMIVSLWQVPDKETAELMTIFYDYLLSGIPVREAFYKSQKKMRSLYAPFSWAAFVLTE
jgi:CHAT domain-containing protein